MAETMDLLIKLHIKGERQGPGSDAITKQALDIIGHDKNIKLNVLDVGCGTGAQTIALAKYLNCNIVAIDLFEDFLNGLKCRFKESKIADKLTTIACSMNEMSFKENTFDLIWSEGAIYNIGFENGLNEWKRFVRPGGYIAVSEITWTTNKRPKEIESHWMKEYPGIETTSKKIEIIEKLGYRFVGAITLPEYTWEEMYYKPMEARFSQFLRNNPGEESKSIVDAERKEIELYRKYKDYYSYVFYIMRKVGTET